MSDVREQLLGVVVGNLRERQGGDSQSLTDAILARFEVTPRPVVTELQLGKMVAKAGCTQYHGDAANINAGQRMWNQLLAAGLTIVRREEVEK